MAPKAERIKVGDLLIDVEQHVVKKRNEIIDLTLTEFNILKILADRPHRVLTRLQIVEQVQGCAFEGCERTTDVHIKNLRRKIEDNPKEPQYIQTVFGIGYRFCR